MEILLLLVGIVLFTIIFAVAIIFVIYSIVKKNEKWKRPLLISSIAGVLVLGLIGTGLVMGLGAFGKSVHSLVEQSYKRSTYAHRTIGVKEWRDGEYRVGKDLLVGEYVAITKQVGYWELTNDADEILFSENFANRTIILLSEGQSLKIENAFLYVLRDAPKAEFIDGFLAEGMYKVGIDIPVGEYRVVADEANSYIKISNSQNLHDANGLEAFEGEKMVLLFDGQYLTVLNGKIEFKQ